MSAATLHLGDAAAILPALPAASFDLVLCDPPYPCIKRSYGTWTEAQWWELMRAVVPECMRVLKPTGSAVFILQPNSERVGRMRTWLWDFMGWVGREWGIVQDAYWWNHGAMPTVHCHRGTGLMRPSLKTAVWVGPPDCYRSQGECLWDESAENARRRVTARAGRTRNLSGHSVDRRAITQAAAERGGVTPFNVLPLAGANDRRGGGVGHSAGTPLTLCSWWTRYLCPPGGRVLDPFAGSGTVGLAALAHGAEFVGIERVPEYVEIARRRIEEAEAQTATPLFEESWYAAPLFPEPLP